MTSASPPLPDAARNADALQFASELHAQKAHSTVFRGAPNRFARYLYFTIRGIL